MDHEKSKSSENHAWYKKNQSTITTILQYIKDITQMRDITNGRGRENNCNILFYHAY